MRVRDQAGIKVQFAVLLACIAGVSAKAQVTITPSSPPVVNQGQTVTFTASVVNGGGVAWSCPGCRGSIDPSTGGYTAPASVKAQQSYGGYQVLPNDHVFNTRIDSLPVNVNSASWIAGAGSIPVNYLPSFPVNFADTSTPTSKLVFAYTPANNGPFQLAPYPKARIESGWFSGPWGPDRHFFAIDTTNGTFQEMYNYYAPGANPSCANCTSQSGVKYANSTYGLPANGATDAAGMYVMPLTLRLQELENAVSSGGTINHALRFTLQNGYIKLNSFIWPATTTTSAGGGVVPYGARFRLKSSFDISGFSRIAQVLLKQLQQYGIILADGGYGWQVATEYTKWPAAYRAAFSEIANAGIGPSNFEAVDESSLEVSPSSGLTTASETVIATSVSNPSQLARQQVVLTGVTLNLPLDEMYAQAGTGAQQLTAYVNGTSNTSATWSMSPAVGALTSAGLYTPPAGVSAAAVTTITATSAADSSVAASMTLTVLPSGPIRIIMGQAIPYTDTQGNVWQGSTGDDGGHSYDNGGTWLNTPDIQLYKVAYFTDNDMRFDITVPNGSYLITGKFAETESNATIGSRLMDLEAQGQVVDSNVDIYASAGGINMPIDFTIPAVVSNGHLAFVLRHVVGDFAILSALQIVPIGGGNPPAPPTNLTVIQAH